jgi:thiol-disulfide isomerase/thioredoxin
MKNSLQKGSMAPAIITIILIAVVVGGIYYFSSNNSKVGEENMQKDDNSMMVEIGDDAMMKKEDGAMMEKDTMVKEGDTMMVKGTYETYATEKLTLADNGKVLLFFHASWCPSCRATDSDINKNLSNIPGNVHILKVDYDKETSLKQKYGVTTQHTFVEVDSKGNSLQKWSGSGTLSDLVNKLK